MSYNVTLPRHSKIGAGAAADLGTLCAQVGIARPVLVTDGRLAQLVARFLHTEEVISSSLVSPTTGPGTPRE